MKSSNAKNGFSPVCVKLSIMLKIFYLFIFFFWGSGDFISLDLLIQMITRSQFCFLGTLFSGRITKNHHNLKFPLCTTFC